MEIKGHTVKSYDKDLQSISTNLNDLGKLVNDAIDIVQEVFDHPQGQIIADITNHDRKINNLDHLIEKQITAMLALRQPLAFDLRYMVSSLKVSSNLERMGDKCKGVIRNIIELDTKIDDKTKKSLLEMLEIAKKMTQESVFAFNNHDIQKANEVLDADSSIDQIYIKLFDMTNHDNFNREQVKNIVNILFIAKNLERLADHATNIAEIVKYVVSGEVSES